MAGSNAVKLKDFARYALPATRSDSTLGKLLQLIAVLTVALGIFIGFVIEPVHINYRIVLAVLSLASLIVGFFFITGKRLQIDTRKKLLDPRAPILYLRPFCHEGSDVSFEPNEVFSYRYRDSLTPVLKLGFNMVLPGGWPSDSVSASDGIIAKALDDIGPVIAVGMPHETLPPVGALRLYFRDKEWKEKVKELMAISRMVVIQPSYSPSIDWELDMARQNFRPEQIYISFLDWADLSTDSRKTQFEIFNLQLERIYGIALPEHFVNAPVIYFDNEWRPVKATISRWQKIILFPTFSTVSTPVLREILRPVLRKRGMRLSVWRTVVYEVVSKSISGIIFFGGLYLCFRFGGK